LEKAERLALMQASYQASTDGSRSREFAGKIALITGASRGLGRAVALKLASEGAKTILCARNRAELADVSENLKSRFQAETFIAAVDLGSPGAAEEIRSSVRDFAERIDILVCCAGATKGGRLEELLDSDWHASFMPKFFGTVALVKQVAPLMRRSANATIVILTGSQGFEPKAENIIGAAVNGALNAVVKALANDLSKSGIRVLGISPGPFDTDRMRTVIADRSSSLGITLEQAREQTIAQVPMRRFGAPEELAEIVAFLAGERAKFLNGMIVTADGGMRRGF
jgi:NAD(P)-dependent dehydrogenase (short-subunit alcohol dehydrogenase family)